MWPKLLNFTHEECCMTLRRLELEAYSNIISVFRAQGELEENRKKLLAELRAVLHISNDRHSAETRRVANDEWLATIAERISGPNTGRAWIMEGRRVIPLLPHGIPQTIYTEIADKVAEEIAAENKDMKNKLEAEKVVSECYDKLPDVEMENAECDQDSNRPVDEINYPPIAMEDQAPKLWDTELICRKRKLSNDGKLMDMENFSTPVKNMRNVPLNTNQRHINFSQIYSKMSQSATSKPSSQSKHSYNQVSKVSSTKSTQSHGARSNAQKHRAHKSGKNSSQKTPNKSQGKKHHESIKSTSHKYNSIPMQLDYTGPPCSFQASYAQSVLGNKNMHDYIEEKPITSATGIVKDSSMIPCEVENTNKDHLQDSSLRQTKITPKPALSKKPCQLVIKRSDITTDKKVHIVQKSSESVKLLSNKQIFVAPSSTQKVLSATGKLANAKVISSVHGPQGSTLPVLPEQIVAVQKTPVSTPTIVISSSSVTQNNIPVATNSVSVKSTETLTPKGIPATDLKVSAKTFVFNSKTGQKMVVLPAGRTKAVTEGQMPVLHIKGISTPMKLVPLTNQTLSSTTKSSAVVTLTKDNPLTTVSSISKTMEEPIRTANMADIVPVKGLTPIQTPRITNPIMRQATTKNNVILLQKRATIGKPLTFTKNGNDNMSKIIMGKNINQLLQASKPEQSSAGIVGNNVIVLELNDQIGNATTMSEILDSRNTASHIANEINLQQITQDTPVIFDNQVTEETCTANSIDSTEDIITDMSIDDSRVTVKEQKPTFVGKESEVAKDSSSTDWEMELNADSRKDKEIDKLNSLHLDLEMASDSENEYIVDNHNAKCKNSSQESIQRTTSSGESSEIFSSSSVVSIATRTLLSQLQDEGSSSNDSSFSLKIKEKRKENEKFDKSECEELNKAKEKLSEKVADAISRQNRIDNFSTALNTTGMNLDPFPYLGESILAEDEFDEGKAHTKTAGLDEQLSRLLGEDSGNSADSQTVSEGLPLHKK